VLVASQKIGGQTSRNEKASNIEYAIIFLSSRQEAIMDIHRERTLFRLADVLIILVSIFVLLDAMRGFTKHQEMRSVQSRPVSQISQNIHSTNLSKSCIGGFSNQRMVDGVTQVAPHGTPFNAYQMTFTNTGNAGITIYSVTVELVNNQNKVFAQQHINLGNGAGITLGLEQSRQIVETAGINQAVASCKIVSW
jgi:hypothetical protein